MIDRIAEFQERFAATTAKAPGVAIALATARGVVARCAAQGKPRFRTPAEFDAAFKREAFRLVDNVAFGPLTPTPAS